MTSLNLMLVLAQAPIAAASHAPKPANGFIEARAVLSCVMTRQYTAKDCQVIEQSPPGIRSGEEALKLAETIRFKQPVGVKGSPGGMRVTIPVKFMLEPAKTVNADPTEG